MKCQRREGKGRPQGLGGAGQRVLGAGQEGHSAPSTWAFLMLSGPVTSFQPRASLTEQAERGAGSKAAQPSVSIPILPWIAGFVLLLSGCSNKSYKHQVRHSKNFLPRLQALTFTHTRQGPGSSQHPPSKYQMPGWERARMPKQGPGSQGDAQRGEKWDHQFLSEPLARGD